MPHAKRFRFSFAAVFGLLAFAALASAGKPDDKDYSGKDLKNKDFTGATLNKANFSDAVLISANFQKASLKNANFKGANIKDANFYEADLTEADLSGAEGPLQFNYTNLTKANMEGMKGEITILTNCNMRGAILRKTKVRSAFSNCDLSGADLCGANLRGCTMNKNGTGRLKGAIYDEDTAFPDNVDPKDFGMVLKEAKKDKP